MFSELYSEVFSEPYQTSKMELLKKIVEFSVK